MAGNEAAPSDDDELDPLPGGTRLRISAVITVALFIILVLVWLLSGGGTELIRKKITLTTYMADAGGLAPGAYVRVNGVRVGRVTRVVMTDTLDPNRVIRVVMQIQRRFVDEIPVDSIAALTADNLVGDKYVNISAGHSAQGVREGNEIAGLIENGSFNPSDLVSSLHSTVQRVDAILSEIETGTSPTAQFVRGSAFYEQASGQISSIQKAISIYSNRQTKVGQLFFREDFYNQVRQPILNLDRSLEEIQRGETQLGRFLTSSKQYDDAVAQVRQVHQSLANANAGQGSAGGLLHSEEQYVELRRSIQQIDRAVADLTIGEGPFARMLQTSELYDSLAGQSARSRDFLREFRQNPRKFLRIKIF